MGPWFAPIALPIWALQQRLYLFALIMFVVSGAINYYADQKTQIVLCCRSMRTAPELLATISFRGCGPSQQAKATTFSGASSRSKNSCSLADVPLLAVADASGYGKSSLVHAGLLNELARRHAMRDGGIEWRAVVMRPGTRPIATLAEQLVAVLTREEIEGEMRAATLEGRLRLGGLALIEASGRLIESAPQELRVEMEIRLYRDRSSLGKAAEDFWAAACASAA